MIMQYHFKSLYIKVSREECNWSLCRSDIHEKFLRKSEPIFLSYFTFRGLGDIDALNGSKRWVFDNSSGFFIYFAGERYVEGKNN
jgi:hypothetical protein